MKANVLLLPPIHIGSHYMATKRNKLVSETLLGEVVVVYERGGEEVERKIEEI